MSMAGFFNFNTVYLPAVYTYLYPAVEKAEADAFFTYLYLNMLALEYAIGAMQLSS